MRKSILPLLAVSALSLSACMTGLGGPGVLGSVLGNVLNSGQGRGGADFQTMAIETCGAEASRYGRVSVTPSRTLLARSITSAEVAAPRLVRASACLVESRAGASAPG